MLQLGDLGKKYAISTRSGPVIFLSNYTGENLFNVFSLQLQFSKVYYIVGSSSPTVDKRICRAIFGCYGDMLHSVAKLLTFVTFFGVTLALTVYYFDVQFELKKLEITSNISKLMFLVCQNFHPNPA